MNEEIYKKQKQYSSVLYTKYAIKTSKNMTKIDDAVSYYNDRMEAINHMMTEGHNSSN